MGLRRPGRVPAIAVTLGSPLRGPAHSLGPAGPTGARWRAAAPARRRPRARPGQHRRPLRPGQRLLRHLPGPDDDLQLGHLRTRRGQLGRGVGSQAGPDVSVAPARSRGSGGRDRLGLGILRHPRRQPLRRAGDHHHHQHRAVRMDSRSGLPPTGSAIGSRCSTRTTATWLAPTTSWPPSRWSRRSTGGSWTPSWPPAPGCSSPTGSWACRPSSSPATAGPA